MRNIYIDLAEIIVVLITYAIHTHTQQSLFLLLPLSSNMDKNCNWIFKIGIIENSSTEYLCKHNVIRKTRVHVCCYWDFERCMFFFSFDVRRRAKERAREREAEKERWITIIKTHTSRSFNIIPRKGFKRESNWLLCVCVAKHSYNEMKEQGIGHEYVKSKKPHWQSETKKNNIIIDNMQAWENRLRRTR